VVALDAEALDRDGAFRPQTLLGPPWRAIFHLETAVKLLKLLECVLAIFSKCALRVLEKQADFDSAIRRFDPSRPSH
jgi:hypothetical protein